MKKLATIFLSTTLLYTTAFADRATVVATYADIKVTEGDVMEQFRPVLDMQTENRGKTFSELDKNAQELMVKSYVTTKLLMKEADKTGVRSSKSFTDKLKNVELQLVQQEVLEDYINKTVTDSIINEEYKKLTDTLKGQKQAKTRHILVNDLEKAKEVKRELSKGKKFSDLAKKYSIDEGSKTHGGEIGYILRGQVVPEYESAAFSMKKNVISEPIKSGYGYHIIEVLDVRDAQVPTKDEAREGIRNKLAKEAVEAFIAKLSTEANVQYILPEKPAAEKANTKTVK